MRWNGDAWTCDPARLPEPLRARFVALSPDPIVEAFAEQGGGHGPVRHVAHALLRHVVSDFDADGWLGTYPMALLGPASWSALLGGGARLLDVGAGSGAITAHARGCFDEIVTTETSRAMARRLRARGFVCHRVDLAREALPDPGPFDAAALLNVLDRCERPRSLLRRVSRLAGRVLISVPLPVRPHVDVGGTTVDPDEPLSGEGERFEEALADLVRGTIAPCGLEVLRLARAPYLSRGRREASGEVEVRALDAALIIARRER